MIAMQYRIVLPSDYPMEKIETRIREKGNLLDGYPGLVFKAYLYARKDAEYYSNSNSYAPFYVWKDHHSMVTFLRSEGFNGLCEQFGRPEVRMWFIEDEPTIPNSKCSLACIDHQVCEDADIHGVNFTSWETVSISWFSQPELAEKMSGDIYSIGYIAHG
ncbi:MULTISPECIES: DUF4865 family protein [Vibrio]|uniref:DUF4865 family protein n=1 Tax=Vibrio ostreae TaxID=2841925 RepID=A0A975U758_9VIBR|nr:MULTISPECIES: DUF4865 family protein [Vibrio]QXO16479.1 DUF4865 family protein [Vibrio ostreae]